jgi:GNAT superfamily N-acetyltransferase
MPQQDTKAIRIEPASHADVETLAKLRVRVHALHVSRAPDLFIEPTDAEMQEVCRALLMEGNARAFIAYADDVPIGYVLALIQERQPSLLSRARRWLYVDQISVEPQWERRGVGQQLVQRVIDLGRSLGIGELITDVWAFNGGAKAFFNACGFRSQIDRFSMRLGE